jgi:hypothetical protein
MFNQLLHLTMSSTVWFTPDEKSPTGPVAVCHVRDEAGDEVAILENRRANGQPPLWEYTLSSGKRSGPIFPSAEAALEAVATKLSS